MPAMPALRLLGAVALLALLLPVPQSALAQEALVPVESGDPGWSRMLALAGRWRLPAPETPRQAAFRVVLAPVSRGTALEERYGNPAGDTTRTLFHRDGARILATHYCAQGNQPRLAWTPPAAADAAPIAFEFVDATNLPDPGASHLVRLTLSLDPEGRLIRDEVYAGRTGEERDVMVLVRDE